MKILNVAEKPSVARQLAAILSKNDFEALNGCNKFCKNFIFKTNIKGIDSDMIMTSVLGHLMEYNFPPELQSWHNIDPFTLLKAIISSKIGKVTYSFIF